MQDRSALEAALTTHGIAGATWIETGTYLGDTTEFLATSLSLRAREVYSFEPGIALWEKACKRLFKDRHDLGNVRVINTLSETGLPRLLPGITGDVCFWLDGHYSDELTHRGPQDTPIIDELAAIGEHVRRWTKVVVLIDDVHLFTGQKHIYGPYPHVRELMDWAKRHTLRYTIESDIFIASNA